MKSSAFCLAIWLAIAGLSPGAALGQESLINPDSFRGPAADRRAYRQGDLLTVHVLEATRARSGAATDASSDTSIRIGLRAPSTDYDASLGLTGDSSGGAETSRIGELRAQISVRVTGVQPGGLLEIAGEQSLVVNGEHQQIVLSGIVREEDVSAANTIWSHRIADARVELTGVGTVSESQRKSLVYRVLKWMRLL